MLLYDYNNVNVSIKLYVVQNYDNCFPLENIDFACQVTTKLPSGRAKNKFAEGKHQ
jgi:hypothetical protein